MTAAHLERKPETDVPALEIPREVWALWSDVNGWIDAFENEGEPKLWYETEEQADEAAAHHAEAFSIHCTPVNLLRLVRG